MLLDDIDTLSDVIKPTNKEGFERFYTEALKLCAKRFDSSKSGRAEPFLVRMHPLRQGYYNGIVFNILPKRYTSWTQFYCNCLSVQLWDIKEWTYLQHVIVDGFSKDTASYTTYRFTPEFVVLALMKELEVYTFDEYMYIQESLTLNNVPFYIVDKLLNHLKSLIVHRDAIYFEDDRNEEMVAGRAPDIS